MHTLLSIQLFLLILLQIFGNYLIKCFYVKNFFKIASTIKNNEWNISPLSAKRQSNKFQSNGVVEEIVGELSNKGNITVGIGKEGSDQLMFPELQQLGLDEKALRKSLFGKFFFPAIEFLFPAFLEPNWFDVYDPPLSPQANMDLPYFDGYDFVNSSWTIYVRHRFGVWNWLDRLGLVPQTTYRVFLRPDGKTMWSDGFYGDWYINPAINFFQIERHYGRGAGFYQHSRGVRLFQIQRWNFEEEVGRYWNRGLRSYLRNDTNYWAMEGRVWGAAVRWRPAPRDQGKFIAIRDGTNLTEVFGSMKNTPWETRFLHSLSLPFYQAHPEHVERIEDNFDMFYTNLLGKEIR